MEKKEFNLTDTHGENLSNQKQLGLLLILEGEIYPLCAPPRANAMGRRVIMGGMLNQSSHHGRGDCSFNLSFKMLKQICSWFLPPLPMFPLKMGQELK